jgi:hypothetical protein
VSKNIVRADSVILPETCRLVVADLGAVKTLDHTGF